MNDVMPIYLAAVNQMEPGKEAPGLLDVMLHAHPVVLLTLLTLVAMSVACGAIIVHKFRVLSQAQAQSRVFLDLFWKSRRLDEVYEQCDKFPASPVAAVFKAGYIELSKLTSQERDRSVETDLGSVDNLTRSLRRAQTVERTAMERMTPILATTGSTAPFIGLFGTVIGILLAFQKIGTTGDASLQTVGVDISEALVATAAGLVAAIPAVMAYNYFNSRIRELNSEMDNFSNDFLNIVKRHFLSAGR